MTPPASNEGPSTAPTVVVLTDHWESRSEPGWLVRQVAGALACRAEVHVVCPDSAQPGTTVDSVFTVHRIDPGADGGAGGPVGLRPISVVFASRTWPDLARLQTLAHRLDIDAESPVIVWTLDGENQDDEAVARLLDRSPAVLVVTEGERSELAEIRGTGDRIHTIGAPLAANPSVLSEPDPLVGDSQYVMVYVDVDEHQVHPAAQLSQLLRMRFPDRTLALVYRDAFCVWRAGRVQRTDPVRRSSDLARLMAWAQVTVDLRPGRLFARRCVESLLYGTPIVVPFGSRAREHADRGRGGLWFANPTELAWCIGALFAPPVRDGLGSQGRAYARAAFGSTDTFIERVLAACGFTPLAARSLETAPGQGGPD